MTARQDQQLGYALDWDWYEIGEFTSVIRNALQSLTVDQVNAAVKRHLTARDLSIVMITKDAAELKQALVSDAFSPITYDGEKPPPLLDQDQLVGALKPNIPAPATFPDTCPSKRIYSRTANFFAILPRATHALCLN